jgi:eukaryotic-like serine/threonine-protein kinase
MADPQKLEALGRLDEAMAVYAKSAQWDHAARVALGLDKNLEAAGYFLNAQRPYDAAVCFQKAGSPRDCLGALTRVPSSSPRYREACVHAVRMTQLIGAPLIGLINFVTPFARTKPNSRIEATAQNQLAAELAQHGRADFALSIYKLVRHAFPDDLEANEGLKELTAAKPASPSAPAGIRPAAAVRPAVTSTARGAPSLPPVAHRPPVSAPKAAAPRLTAVRLGPLLVARGLVTQPQLDGALKENPALARSDVQLGLTLVARGMVLDEQMVAVLSELTNIPYVTDKNLYDAVCPDARGAVTQEQSEKWQVVPISKRDRKLHLAMRNPRDVELIDKLRFACGVVQVVPYFATDHGIREAARKLFHGKDSEFSDAAGPPKVGSHPPPPSAPAASAPERDRPPPAAAPVLEADVVEAEVLEAEVAAEAAPVESASGRSHAPIEIEGWETEAPPAEKPVLDAGYVSVSERDFDPEEMERRMLAADAPPADAAPAPTAAPAVAPPTLGSVFAGRYRFDDLLGEGGTSSVFKVQDLEIDDAVALKLFRPSTPAEAEQLLTRFKMELALSRQLTHPNIIRLFDLGAHEGWRFLTMELLEGRDVGQVLERSAFPLREGLGVLEQVCSALQFIHERGIVHRDIKPQNVFITKSGQVKLLDFGLAKKKNVAGAVTMMGMVAGTPWFISPEQVKSFSNVTPQSDLYSLGATAYALFTGRPPFEQEELLSLLMAHATERPPPPREKNPHIPEALEAAILKLLEKDPAQRIQSAAELGEILREIREAL